MTRGRPIKRITEIALAHHGFITVADARQAGIEAVRLRQLAARGTLARVSQGVYRLASVPPGRLDDYFAASLWPRQGASGVMSHETALDIHDLCDVNPADIDITLPRRYRADRRQVPAHYRLHLRDLAPGTTTDREGLPIVTPVQAILDGIESGLRTSLIRQAIETLRGRGELDTRAEARVYAALDQRFK